MFQRLLVRFYATSFAYWICGWLTAAARIHIATTHFDAAVKVHREKGRGHTTLEDARSILTKQPLIDTQVRRDLVHELEIQHLVLWDRPRNEEDWVKLINRTPLIRNRTIQERVAVELLTMAYGDLLRLEGKTPRLDAKVRVLGMGTIGFAEHLADHPPEKEPLAALKFAGRLTLDRRVNKDLTLRLARSVLATAHPGAQSPTPAGMIAVLETVAREGIALGVYEHTLWGDILELAITAQNFLVARAIAIRHMESGGLDRIEAAERAARKGPQ